MHFIGWISIMMGFLAHNFKTIHAAMGDNNDESIDNGRGEGPIGNCGAWASGLEVASYPYPYAADYCQRQRSSISSQFDTFFIFSCLDDSTGIYTEYEDWDCTIPKNDTDPIEASQYYCPSDGDANENDLSCELFNMTLRFFNYLNCTSVRTTYAYIINPTITNECILGNFYSLKEGHYFSNYIQGVGCGTQDCDQDACQEASADTFECLISSDEDDSYMYSVRYSQDSAHIRNPSWTILLCSFSLSILSFFSL